VRGRIQAKNGVDGSAASDSDDGGEFPLAQELPAQRRARTESGQEPV